jgi:hypothetical protein
MFWSVGDGPRRAGRVEVGADAVDFTATSPDAEVAHVAFRDLARILLESGVLRLQRRGAPDLRVGSLDAPGALRALAERLTDLAAAT